MWSPYRISRRWLTSATQNFILPRIWVKGIKATGVKNLKIEETYRVQRKKKKDD